MMKNCKFILVALVAIMVGLFSQETYAQKASHSDVTKAVKLLNDITKDITALDNIEAVSDVWTRPQHLQVFEQLYESKVQLTPADREILNKALRNMVYETSLVSLKSDKSLNLDPTVPYVKEMINASVDVELDNFYNSTSKAKTIGEYFDAIANM